MTCISEGCLNPKREPTYRKDGSKSNKSRCAKCESNISRYGLTTPERDTLLEQQDFKCKACSNTISFSGHVTKSNIGESQACVDHCHITGKVRGILCGACNVTLGKSLESTERLRKLANYLEENS